MIKELHTSGLSYISYVLFISNNLLLVIERSIIFLMSRNNSLSMLLSIVLFARK